MSRRLRIAILAITLCTSLSPASHARLGETEAQSQARYGEPKEGILGPQEKPLLPGAKEWAYLYEGWRIRAAFVNGVTVRIEYVHLSNAGAPVAITEGELTAVLEGEKGRFTWREEKPRTGYKELNALKTALEGRQWERSDHAKAVLKANLLLVLESRDADDLEKRLARTPQKGSAPNAPRF